MWSYTSRGILKLKTVAGEVGSSTMPHKVNPIDYEATLKALTRITVNSDAMLAELNGAWEVLAEPAQTLLRKNQVEGAYELLKAATRGKDVNNKTMREFIETLESHLPPADMECLRNMKP